MKTKNALILAASATVLSSAACLIYNGIYKAAFMVDFSTVAAPVNIVVACAIGCILMALGYTLGLRWLGAKSMLWLNLLFGTISFASIVGVLGFNLPLDIEFPEMFPGLMVPMHFFPLMAMLILWPLAKLNQP